jgi:hypothetical protein
MRAKLYKVENTFYLKEGETILGTSSNPNLSASIRYSLSLKNCEAIPNGYDLDELAMGYDLYENINFVGQTRAYKAGFNKAMELNKDKVFTLEDMMNCWNKALKFQEHKETLGEYIQSLQQPTEIDVEIESKIAIDGHTILGYELDENGCLILKRIKE